MTDNAAPTRSPSPPDSAPAAKTVAIDGAFTIAHVMAWRDRFLGGGCTARVLTLDFAAVEAIDVFGVQLVWSLHRTLVSGGGRLDVIDPAGAFGRACTEIGLEPSALVPARSSNS